MTSEYKILKYISKHEGCSEEELKKKFGIGQQYLYDLMKDGVISLLGGAHLKGEGVSRLSMYQMSQSTKTEARVLSLAAIIISILIALLKK